VSRKRFGEFRATNVILITRRPLVPGRHSWASARRVGFRAALAMASEGLDAPLLDASASPWAPGSGPRGSASNGDEEVGVASDSAASETRVDVSAVATVQPRAPHDDHLESLDYEPVHNDVGRHELLRRRERRGRDRRRFYGYTGLTLAKSSIALFVGVAVGATAFAIDAAVDGIFDLKRTFVLEKIGASVGANVTAVGSDEIHDFSVVHFFTNRARLELVGAYVAACVFLVVAASALCVFWAPQAAGGGVTGVMAFLNGSSIPDLLGTKALVAKVVGVICAVGSSLAVGPEGPMVHVGAAVASCVVLAAPNRWLKDGEEAFFARDEDDDDVVNDDDLDDDLDDDAERRPLQNYPRSEDGDARSAERRRSYAPSSRSKAERVRSRDRTTKLCIDLSSHLTRREFVSAGAAAGLAAAFGAPVGGVLFSLEEASTYWSRKVMWRSFVCASAASITLAMCRSAFFSDGGGALFLDSRSVRTQTPKDYLHQVPFFVFTAALGGVAGVLFNALTSFFARFIRPRHEKRVLRVVDCVVVVTVTVIARFLAASIGGRCVETPDAWANASFGERWRCSPGSVNDVASVLFGSPSQVIGRMLSMGEITNGRVTNDSNDSDSIELNSASYGFTSIGLSISAFLYLPLMAAAYGLAVPGGVFLPSVFLGASGGGAFGLALRSFLPKSWDVQPGVYALIGATATLAGVFRSSISLVVIMVEGTGGIAFAFPIIVAVAVSNATCAFFAHASESSSGAPSSVYHLDLERNEKVVFLPGEPPRSFKHLTAADLMCSGPVQTVRAEGETPARVARMLKTSTHHGFPAVDRDGRLLGLSSRAQLEVLVATHVKGGRGANVGDAHRDRLVLDARMRVAHLTRRRARGAETANEGVDASGGSFSHFDDFDDFDATGVAETASALLDVAGFMHRAPLCVHLDHPATRVHLLFTTLGLRHLCVVDSSNRVAGVITRKDVTRAESEGRA
jgi:chloride channel 7